MSDTFTPVTCLKCGELPTGTVETLSGIALLQLREEPDTRKKPMLEYSGETEVEWDSQATTLVFGYPLFWCGKCRESFVGISGDIREEDVPHGSVGEALNLARDRGFFLRLRDGSVNNCSRRFGEEEKSCQTCRGTCPDRTKEG